MAPAARAAAVAAAKTNLRAIASAAKPGAAGRPPTSFAGDRERGEAGRSGSPAD